MEIVDLTNSLEEMLYQCWAFNQDEDFSFIEPEFWGPYLAKFKFRFSQETSETVDASGAADGDDNEVKSLEQVDEAQ